MAGISDKKKIIYFIFIMILVYFIIVIKMKNILKFSNSSVIIEIRLQRTLKFQIFNTRKKNRNKN